MCTARTATDAGRNTIRMTECDAICHMARIFPIICSGAQFAFSNQLANQDRTEGKVKQSSSSNQAHHLSREKKKEEEND